MEVRTADKEEVIDFEMQHLGDWRIVELGLEKGSGTNIEATEY